MERTKDGFLELVSEKYNDDELVEWEPAPAPMSRPEEPGDLGKSLFFQKELKLNYNALEMSFYNFVYLFNRSCRRHSGSFEGRG